MKKELKNKSTTRPSLLAHRRRLRASPMGVAKV